MKSVLLENKGFRNLWLGQLISALGDRITQMGLLTFIMVISGDKGTKMALITFFTLLPFLLFGPLFGAITDRYSRRKIMIIADVIRAGLVLLVPFIWVKTHSVGYMVGLVFMLGAFSALFSPAKMSIIPNIVKKNDLVEANSLVVTTGMIATLVGTLVAGAVIKMVGVKAAFYVDSLSYLASAVLIGTIAYKASFSKEKEINRKYRLLVSDIKEGVRYIFRHHLIMRLIQLSAVFSLLTGFGYIIVLNYFTTRLQSGPFEIGMLLAACGLGMIAGSYVLIKRKDRVNYQRALYLSFLVIAIGLGGFLTTPDEYTTGAILMFSGVGLAILTITLNTILQRVVPDNLKGKVFGARGVLTNSVFLLSLLAVGALIEIIDVRVLFGLMAAVSFIASGLIYLSRAQWAYQVLRWFLRGLMKMLFSFEVSGLENLPDKDKVILAGNHTSLIDGVALMCAYPRRVYFLVAELVFNMRPWGWFARQLGFIPIKRGGLNKEAMQEAYRILSGNKSIGIFPEGKITEDGQLAEGKKGVAVIARHVNAPIIPFAIEGAYEAWPKGQKLFKRFPVKVRFGKPIDIEGYEVEEELVNEVMAGIKKEKLQLEREGYLRADPADIIKHLINIDLD